MKTETLALNDLKKLIDKKTEPAISIFIPTFRKGREIRQNSIYLKNAIKIAEELLEKQGYQKEKGEEVLQPLKELIEDTIFWENQAEGLAIFSSPGFFKYYSLPITFQETVLVNQTFHIKPLLPLFTENGQFFVLALSEKMVKMYECSKYSYSEVELENVPENIEEALGHEVSNTTLQFHSGVGQGRRDASPIYHGQGSMKDQEKDRLFRYFKALDKSLHKILNNRKRPLILAAVDYYLPLFKEASSYKNISDKSVEGNPEECKKDELHKKAWTIIEPYFKNQGKEVISKYKELNGLNQASNNLKDIILAAFEGRLDKLIISPTLQVWGKFNAQTGEAEIHRKREPTDEDLLDIAAIYTLKNNGVVYAIDHREIPKNSGVVGIFRY